MNGEHCFLLGAGFSRAVSSTMPVLSDLKDGVLRQLGVDETVLDAFGKDLEQWMSYLSVDQPWLSYSENLRNRATFSEASHAVSAYIVEAELKAMSVPIPSWLNRLVGTWFDTESTLLSFNYDTLIERVAAEQRRVSDWGDIYRIPLNIRPRINHGLIMGAGRYSDRVPELFKLHGSTNWAFSGLDSSPTDPVNITKSYETWIQGDSPTPRRGEDAARYADLEPLIIPPTGTKGTFYSNRALQAQWRDAFQLLKSAGELTIVGYSFPISDLGARHFVANALPPDIPVTIVDYSDETAARIRNFLGKSHEYLVYVGDEAVSNFVQERCGDFVVWGTQNLGESPRPYFRVNDKPNLQAELEWSNRAFATEEECQRFLDDVVEKLYPGLVERGIESWSGQERFSIKLAVSSI